MRFLVAACGLSIALLAPASAQTARPSVKLVPHRAVYDLSLLRAGGSNGVDHATGRIAMEFGGDACEGYTLKYRQVTILNSSESGSNTLDIQTATYEAGDGRSMHFKSSSFRQGMIKDGEVDGDAKLTPQGNLNVDLKQPKRKAFGAPGETVFPTEHLKRLIEAGRRGDTTLSVKVYDGSNKGDKVYETLGLIGRKIEAGAASASLEDVAQGEKLASVARWPITISYFEEGKADRTPVYTISFQLYENGVSRDLKLDYGDFALKGELKSLDLQASSSCSH
ncbi:cell envelope integrity EipB family protein [Microvirga sp. HBU67558]|uniref:cell envelope integrity EipB family protein n=1 Tax=Microvirga TaxID=186650 RepID=UPI001B363C0E|nr:MULTISPECIES: cell envelope integrity EipB family protein [unclassified Microvirga]MBQ0824350.1 cell envelope integrity EipB family protein [Microvirga sp. HBU67558]